ncbi:putative glycosyl transferase, family 1 [Helianthus debilis subsp. tardiflorus]
MAMGICRQEKKVKDVKLLFGSVGSKSNKGIEETFGRVTNEAMAFGIPVLGTDAGGTKKIVEHNVTGLLHPIGHPGTPTLSKHLRYLLKNPSERQPLGLEGREKVKKVYLKKHIRPFSKFFTNHESWLNSVTAL